MVKWMRIANAVLAALVVFGGTLSFLLDFTKNLERGGWAYIVGYSFGYFGFLVLGSAAFYLAWRALGVNSTIRIVRWARRANFASVGLVFLVLLFGTFSGNTTSLIEVLPLLFVMLFWAIPLTLNIAVLGKQKATLEETKTAQTTEPLAQTSSDVAADVSTTGVSAPSSAPLLSSNYFLRHWRGELSLGISYWLNSNLATIAALALIAAVTLMEEGGYSLRTISFAGIGGLLFSVAATVWSLVGIWRSANHHVARGGSPGWANAARVMVVLGSLVATGQLAANILPQLKEYVLIASGNDPVGNIEIKVATNGQSVIVHGMLREGSAVEVQRILDAAPGANLLVLNSGGGRLLEARRLAHLVRTKTLDTYVEDMCVSACTYVFLAGKDRAVTPNARIGFHQPSFPGLDAATQKSFTEDMLDVYRAAELPESFIQRIAKTSPEDIWYPTRDELIAAHVITRVSLGGEAAMSGLSTRSKQEILLIWRNIPLFQAIEKRFPGTTNEAVERAWAAKERGGTDADIQNAGRSVIMGIVPRLLKTADVSTLDSFVTLTIDEMSAAQAISGEACAKLMVGKLDVVNTLPKEILQHEEQLMLLALASPSTTTAPPPNPDQLNQAIQKMRDNLPEKYITVVDDVKAYANQPDLVCEAMIAFYRAIAALPPQERHIALRGMFQGEG